MSNKSKSKTGGAFGNGPKQRRRQPLNKRRTKWFNARPIKETTDGMPYHEAVAKERESQ